MQGTFTKWKETFTKIQSILVKTNPKERKKLYLNTLNPTSLG
jgi:hypothetical protein